MMKKLLLLLFTFSSFLFTNLCEGQFNTYHPFPNNNAMWFEDFQGFSTCAYSIQYDYYLRGDTVVNGKTYFKLDESGGYGWAPCPPYGVWYDYDYLICLLREDTAAKQIYASFGPNWGLDDTLLYDFNLNTRDTLPPSYVNDTGGANKVYVKKIDSILIGTEYRKQFIITSVADSSNWSDSIIEGIGSTQGLLEPMVPGFEAYNTLVCFSQNDKTVYPDSTGNCQRFYLAVPTIVEQQTQIDVYPNPSKGIFTLSFSHPELARPDEPFGRVSGAQTICVYNVLGENILIEAIHSVQGDNLIDLSTQPNGIYLYRVMTQTGEMMGEGKLIIQK